MYFLAMDEERELEGIVSFAAFEAPPGMIRFGGRLLGTGGTGFNNYRTYGMFALVLVLGNGAYRDKLGTNRRVTAGDLIAVFPDLAHQYGPEAGDVWDELFISFEGAAFDQWRIHGLDPAHPVWSLPTPEEWAERFMTILMMPVTNKPESCAAASAIHLLIAEALALRPPDGDPNAWLEAACQSLSGGTGAPSLQEIATNLGMGYETFRKAFRTVMGESPARYRKRRRLAQAAVMMKRLDLSLEMIADALDFCDGFHLSKAFKAEYGYSPAQLRRQLHDQKEPAGPRIRSPRT
ncbi:MAG: AraC family transcriptional regulator [Verrucomicrobiota bacterium]